MRRRWAMAAVLITTAVLASCGGSPGATSHAPAKVAAADVVPAATPAPVMAGGPVTAAGPHTATGPATGGAPAPTGVMERPGLAGQGGLAFTGNTVPGVDPWTTDPLIPLAHRTAGPVTLRLFTTKPANALQCDPYATQCLPPWCEPTALMTVEYSTDDIAGRAAAEVIGVGPGHHLSLLRAEPVGTQEGHPRQLVMTSVSDDVDHVSLRTSSGSDTAAPVSHLVALTADGGDSNGTLTAYDARGNELQSLVVSGQATATLPECQPQPIKLPTPGVQPADRDAAIQGVRAAFANAFTHAPPGGDSYHGLATVQDGDRLHHAVDEVRRNFPQAFATITVTTGGIVFTDPTHAVVRFTPTYAGGAAYGEHNGSAVLTGDRWLVAESTYCGLLRFGAATCP